MRASGVIKVADKLEYHEELKGWVKRVRDVALDLEIVADESTLVWALGSDV